MLNMLFENAEILILLINTISVSISYILFLSYIVNGFTLYAIPLFLKVILPILISVVLTVYILFKAYRAIQDEMENLEVELQSYRDSTLTYYNKYKELQQMIATGGSIDTIIDTDREPETSYTHQQREDTTITISSSLNNQPPSSFNVAGVMGNTNASSTLSSYIVKVILTIPNNEETLYQKVTNALANMGYLKTNNKGIFVHKQVYKEKNVAQKIQDETKRRLKDMGIYKPTVVIEAMSEQQAEDYIGGVGE